MAAKKDITMSASEQKKEQLRQLLMQKVKQPVELAASCAQRRLWLVNQLEQPNASYNILCHINLRGLVDIALLEESINKLIARHSVLRTSFKNNDGEPAQVIVPELKLSLPFTDLTTQGDAAKKNQIAEILVDESAYIFDLSSDALIRVKLIQTERSNASNDDAYILVMVLHHIISDGWSMGVLTRDLFSIYDRLRNKLEPLKPLKLQYSDYSQRQSRWLSSDDYHKQLDYWKNYLQDASLLELPTDFPRPLVKGFAGKNILTQINSDLVKKLKALSDKNSITLNMLLSTAFALLLHRYTGQEDIVFGSPVANRNQSDIENLIGFFVNMLVIRSRLDDSDSFSSLLQKTRENLFSAYSNQDVPFEKLVDALQPERERSRNPLFQVVFAMQNEAMPAIELDGISISKPVIPGYDVSEYGVKASATRFDLELHCWDTEDDIRCSWIYDTAMFKEATIKAMSDTLLLVLQQVVQKHDTHVSDINTVTDEQFKRFYMDFNDVESCYPEDKTVADLFEQQVAKTPDMIAVSYNGEQLSYKELDIKSSQLANYILSQNGHSLSMIGVYLERGLDMVISLLAILKSGAAYVPLDIDYPVARLEYMIDDADLSLIITTSMLQSRLTVSNDKQICLDDSKIIIDSQELTVNAVSATAEDIAYVIYTSGSTGQPKGVMIPHKGISRLVINTNYCQIKTTDRIAQASNVSFDAATFEIWGSLLNGATLVGMSKDVLLSAQSYSDFMERNQISITFITTALFNLISTEKADSFSGIRVLLFGGDAVNPAAVSNVLKAAPPEHLLHVYGPTESTTFATWYEVTSVADDAVTIPIGEPLSNTGIYLLDKNLKPVPPGAYGELCIAGDGLAKGYLNRDDLTKERFVSFSLKNKSNQRCYRTGDFARFDHNGMIEFVGRMDNQVKLRGFRIEISEIEITLRKVENIKDAVVMLREDEPGYKRLSAYIVIYEDNETTVSEARDYLKTYLPEYMVPSTFTVIDKIELTSNGKFDYKKLPVPDAERHIQNSMVSLHGQLENSVAAVWKRVLGLTEIGAEDNFFDLGGDSFLMIQLHAALEETLQRNIPITDLFRFSTIHAFAQHFDVQSSDASKREHEHVQSRASKQRAAMRKIRRVSK